MTYAQLVELALIEVNSAAKQIEADNARRQMFRQIATRQQLDTIALALNTHK